MTSDVYKVVRIRREPRPKILPAVINLTLDFEYRVGEVAKPPVKTSYLMAFKDIIPTMAFYKTVLRNYIGSPVDADDGVSQIAIYRAQAQISTNRIHSLPLIFFHGQTTATSIREFWDFYWARYHAEGDNYLFYVDARFQPTFNGLAPAPDGTILCESVMLTDCILTSADFL